MRNLILEHDLKILIGGAAVAATVGVLLGAAIHPDLAEGAAKAPQIMTASGGAREAQVVSDAGVGAYAGKVPDYVIGTDSLKPPVVATVAYEEDAPAEAGDVMAYEAPVEIRPARWTDEPRPAPHYPSERGNTAYGADQPAPQLVSEPVSG